MIVDEHAVVREGIAAVLRVHPDLQVVASVSDGAGALAAAAQTAPDVALVDLPMPVPYGLEVLEQLRADHPHMRIVVLSTRTGDEVIYQALRRGVVAYLPKTMGGDDLIQAIRQGVRGRHAHPPEIAARLAERASYDDLTPREVEVLGMLARGESNKGIADGLGISWKTVKNHMQNIRSKLHTSNRTQCVAVAVRRGIIALEA